MAHSSLQSKTLKDRYASCTCECDFVNHFTVLCWTLGDPYFSFDGCFLCRFSTFCEKMKKIYRVEF